MKKSNEIIFVDDGSSDSSVSKILQLRQRHAGVKLVRLKRNYGQYTATVCGISCASGRHIVTLDAEGSPPASVIALLADNMHQSNLLYAEPVEGERSAFRKWGSRLFDAIVRVSVDNPAVLPGNSGSPMRMMSTEFAERTLASLPSPLMLDIVLMNLANDSIRFIPIAPERSFSVSSYSNLKRVILGIRLLFATLTQRMFRVKAVNPARYIAT